LGGTEGCTHLVELLAPIATTAFQTIFPMKDRQKQRREQRGGEPAPRSRPRILDTSHALRSDGDVVKQFWPEFYRGP
jgi:hypothetical protein